MASGASGEVVHCPNCKEDVPKTLYCLNCGFPLYREDQPKEEKAESEVKPESSFVDDLNADSLDLVELVMSLEEEFSNKAKQIEIPDEDAEKIKTVQDAVDYIKEQGVEDE